MNDETLSRIANALETIAIDLHSIARSIEGITVAGPLVDPDPVQAPPPEKKVDSTEKDYDNVMALCLLTNEELKTVTAPFKTAGQTTLAKECIQEAGVQGLSELTTKDMQKKFLSLAKDKAKLLPAKEYNDVITAINILSTGV
jgi:hypothetical protein